MAISKTLVVSLNQDRANPEEKMFIYRGDVGVDIYIELSNLSYQFNKKKNNYRYVDALFRTPSGVIHKISNLTLREGIIKFSFTEEIVKQMQEIGKYELQFQLYDNVENRLTIPPYYFEVKEPLEVIGEGDEEEARVDYSRVGYAWVGEDSTDLFAIEDGYIKTNWQTGDLITATKLNNLEAGVEYLFDNLGQQSSDSNAILNNTNRISKLEKDMSTVKNNIATTNTNINSVKQDVNTLKADMKTTKEDIEWLKENGSGGGDVSMLDITYKSTIPSTISAGGIPVGYVPPEEGIKILDLIDEMLHPYIYSPPKISFSINPSGTLYELGTIINNLRVTANVTKGIEEITEVGILQSGRLLGTSNNSFSKTIEEVKSNTSFSAYVTDGVQRVNSNTISINFINPIYIGALTEVNEGQIKAMTKKVVNVSGQSYTYTIDTKRMCIAVPSGWTLKSIIDPNNFNITESFSTTTINITCLDGNVRPYTVYYSGYTSQSSFVVKFNF